MQCHFTFIEGGIDLRSEILIQGVTIYAENEIIENGFLLIGGGRIIEISEYPILLAPNGHTTVIDGSNLNAIPGFIDSHIHGAKGFDTMDATEQALDCIASSLPEEGTTSFLATTITQSQYNIEKALENISQYENKPGNAEILGVHLEGPFINKEKKGAQPEAYIIEPDVKLFKQWQRISNGLIKTITLAPECDRNNLISYLAKNRYNVSAGHSMATFEEIKESVLHGVRQLTHLCNAMTGIHHREVGALGAAFLLESLKSELIADEIHTSSEMLQIIYNNISSDRIILITDAMRAKSLKEGVYELGGQQVHVKDNRATLQDGTLAGSILRMIDAVKNMYKLKGVTIKDVIKMAAENPAKQIDVFDRKGSIARGKDADVLLVDNDFNIKYTICRGNIAYEE